MAYRDNEITAQMLSTIRGLKRKPTTSGFGLLKEEAEDKSKDDKDDDNKEEKDDKFEGAIAITNDPKYGQNVLDNQIEQFKAAVDSGAEFAEVKENGKVSDNPLIYLPANGNLIFSGVIPRLNNLKFQFLLKTNTGDGLFIWADGMILNNENIKTIAKLYGFYQNWCDQWNKESKDFKTMVDNEKKK